MKLTHYPIRVALGSFSIALKDGLGADEHGKQMTEAYKARIKEIYKLIVR